MMRLFPRVTVDTTPLPASTKMLVALGTTGKHVYEGTVPASTKARRRQANRTARKARRAAR